MLEHRVKYAIRPFEKKKENQGRSVRLRDEKLFEEARRVFSSVGAVSVAFSFFLKSLEFLILLFQDKRIVSLKLGC